jgi:hypothetical protein
LQLAISNLQFLISWFPDGNTLMGPGMVPKSPLPAAWELPSEIRARVGEKTGKQRAMVADGHLLLVVHRLPRKNETDRAGRFLWRKPDGTWLSSDAGPGAGALDKHLREYADVVERYDHLQDEASGLDDYQAIIEGLAPIHRTIRNLHAALQDAREKVKGDRDLINARDRAYELERAAELLVGDARNDIQYLTAQRAEEQAEAAHRIAVSGHRLNLLAAFFFPIAALTAIFGTNLSHPLEKYVPPPFAFLGVIGSGLVLGGLLAVYLLTASLPPAGKKK